MSGRRKFNDWWLWLWGIPTVLALSSLACFLGASNIEYEMRVINASPIRVEATVVAIDDHYRRRGGTSYSATVEFVTVSGAIQRETFDKTSDSTRYQLGDTITVRYASTKPEFVHDVRYPKDPGPGRLLGWILGGLSVLISAFAAWVTWVTGVVPWRERKRKNELKQRKRELRRTRHEQHLRNS